MAEIFLSILERYEKAIEEKMSLLYFVDGAMGDMLVKSMDMLSFASPIMRIGDAMTPEDISIEKIRDDITSRHVFSDIPIRARLVKKHLTGSRD